MSIKHPNGLVNENNLPTRICANISSKNKGIELQDLDDNDLQSDDSELNNINPPQVNFPVEGFDLKTYISSVEVKIIEEALDNTDGVIAHAAKSLGLRRTTLAEKMRKYNIDRYTGHPDCNAC
jgi:sigma-54 specific flagellar transcriptional regulator A